MPQSGDGRELFEHTPQVRIKPEIRLIYKLPFDLGTARHDASDVNEQ
jgi:hypothetical protein